MTDHSLYERDFYAWANGQAALLRAGRLSAVDVEHIAEEIESLGRAEQRELIRLLIVLLTHLLKWQYQPAFRGPSWEVTIRTQRSALRRHLKDSPSLVSRLPEAVDDAFVDARAVAYGETGLPEVTFPVRCPWPMGQIMDTTFWPADAAH
jgi:hypothetical protein